jgi:hypothetical protein
MDWRIYSALVYDVLIAGLVLAAVVGSRHFLSSAKSSLLKVGNQES